MTEDGNFQYEGTSILPTSMLRQAYRWMLPRRDSEHV